MKRHIKIMLCISFDWGKINCKEAKVGCGIIVCI